MIQSAIHVIMHILHGFVRVGAILQSAWGWLLGIGLFAADYVAGHSFTVWLVLAVTLLDAAWGIAVSVHLGKFTLSELARLTVAKIAVYGSALFVFIGLDRYVDSNITTSVVGALIVLIEFWSSCGSMLILFPNFLFLRLMKKALVGEIASKLHISEEEAKELMEGRNE